MDVTKLSIDELFELERNYGLPSGVKKEVDGVLNFRDVGHAAHEASKKFSFDGLSFSSKIRFRKLYRSAGLENLTTQGEETLIDLGISKVIDLRSLDEVNQFGKDNFTDISKGKIEVINIPIESVIDDNIEDDEAKISPDDFLTYGFWSMKQLYSGFVVDPKIRAAFGEAIKIIASSDACLIHCRSGKDRTGWLSFLCNFICGTASEVAYDEYLMSKDFGIDGAKRLSIFYKGAYQNSPADKDWRLFLPFSSVYKEYLDFAVELAVSNFGSINNYLVSCGITQEIIEQLRSKFLTSPKLTVLAGPTAVGKGTVSRKLIEKYPEIYLSISATTRKPREGEVDGIHYHFLSHDDFDDKIAHNSFLEWATVHQQNKYGTLKQPIEDALKDNRPVLLEIDLQGARQIRESGVDAQFVFLAPPSFEELITRLGMRGTESKEERLRRLETAKEEMKARDEFDFVVINNEIDLAVDELAKIVV